VGSGEGMGEGMSEPVSERSSAVGAGDGSGVGMGEGMSEPTNDRSSAVGMGDGSGVGIGVGISLIIWARRRMVSAAPACRSTANKHSTRSMVIQRKAMHAGPLSQQQYTKDGSRKQQFL